MIPHSDNQTLWTHARKAVRDLGGPGPARQRPPEARDPGRQTPPTTARRSSNTIVTASDVDDQPTYHVERAPDRSHLIALAIVLSVTPKWTAIA